MLPFMPIAKLRILLADEDHALRPRLRRLLADELPRARVVEASTKDETLALLATDGFDAVLLDIRIDGEDGLQMIRVVRAAAPAVRLLAMSAAREEPAWAAAALKVGADRYLSKVRAPEELVPALRALFTEAR